MNAMQLSESVRVRAAQQLVELPQARQLGEKWTWYLAEETPKQGPVFEVFDGLKHDGK
jgi:hypothetical protein